MAETLEELLEFKAKNGYPKGFTSVEQYESWIEKARQARRTNTTPLGDKQPTAKVDLSGVGKSEEAIMADRAIAKTSKWISRAGGILAGVAIAATAVDMGINHQDKVRIHRQMDEQRVNEKKKEEGYKAFNKKTYYDAQMLDGLPQQLYSNRNGHSNTWGGNKY